MTLTVKSRTYLYLTGLFVFLGILAGRGEFFIMSLPLAISLCTPLFASEKRDLNLKVINKASELVEGNDINLKIQLQAQESLPLVNLIHHGQLENTGKNFTQTVQLSLEQGEDRELSLTFPTKNYPGIYRMGDLSVELLEPWGTTSVIKNLSQSQKITVFPRIDLLENVNLINKPRLYHGNYTSSFMGEGLEFSEIKEYRHGDSLKHINWKKSLKWGGLLVNDRYLDRNIDAILLIDCLTQVKTDEKDYLHQCARGAASLAYNYIERKDRVGLIIYDGTIKTTLPQSGEAQLKTILRQLAALRKSYSYVARQVTKIPRFILPPQGIVYGFTNLCDDRAYNMFLDLASRGFQLVLIYISPFEMLNDELGDDSNSQVAKDIWKMKHESRINTLKNLGASVVETKGERLGHVLSRMEVKGQRRGSMALSQSGDLK
ncbi:DUF58 domain-containing protein [Natranaerobius thermophilus]|uniref:DUF58 domain-containing protein n=1 Tax=Natranaerobius thermophilus (strain ATCC BAA-1301 / DSM 18059 / JW/NM-WN-LF) TaxID=457570 RepID=B2A7G3_NATTJ|nr:DUF58 domain-containing protein [Natranaerobius thermophilus]ACB85672.1 protein of unknown function DUF58 [Natranaerobius thermophilus JW/NM-WN-LF]